MEFQNLQLAPPTKVVTSIECKHRTMAEGQFFLSNTKANIFPDRFLRLLTIERRSGREARLSGRNLSATPFLS